MHYIYTWVNLIGLLQQQTVLRFLKPFETNSFDPEVVNTEKEDLDYVYSE